jgi:hypothetical protein
MRFTTKLETHPHALALYFVFPNFCRNPKTLRTSTAMASGISDALWSLEDLVRITDEREAAAPKINGASKYPLDPFRVRVRWLELAAQESKWQAGQLRSS